MQTKERVSPYTAVDWKRKFAQFPSTRRHIPRLPWPRLWRFRRLVHVMAYLLFVTATTVAATHVQAQAAPGTFAEIDSQDGSTMTGDGPGTRMSSTVGNRGEMDPRITIATNRDTIIGGMEDLVLTITRTAPLDERLSLTVKLAQEQSWLDDMFREVTIAADKATASVAIRADKFSADVVESGDLTATVDTVSGYDTKDATATAYVVSQRGPAIKVSFSHEVYRFAENRADPFVIVVAQAVPGMPRGSTVMFSVSSRSGTAGSPGDYEALSTLITVSEADFAFENGLWQTQYQLPFTLIDDEIREGTERFDLILERAPGTPIEVQLSDLLGVPCQNNCATPVEITDGEDIPALALSVNPTEIMEEGETSSNATVVSTNGKSFATDQVVTLRFAGAAIQGVDYTVTPDDDDDDAPDHQMPLPAGSKSVEMKLKAMSDEVDEPDEKIEVSAAHDGAAIGEMRAIRIMNQRMEMPAITLAANRDTIIAGMEDLVFTATREALLDEALTVTVRLTQEQSWLSQGSIQLNFPVNGATSTFTAHAGAFSSGVTESGTIVAVMGSVSGYDTGDATATVYVVSQLNSAVRASFSGFPYTFAENAEDPTVTVVAWTAPGMPRAATVTFSVISRSGTARSGDDFTPLSEMITLPEEDFRLVAGVWTAQHDVPVSLLDDEVREDIESFDLLLQPSPGHPSELELLNIGGAECQEPPCAHPVHITDDEDIPELELSVSEEEIREEGETSSSATVSITNGKTFATGQAVTLKLDGDAIQGSDYRVTPADADEGTEGHQVTLPEGVGSVDVNFTAIDDKREEGDERIRLSVTHDGNAIGRATIRIVDRFPGPGVEITFEGVQPPRDQHDAGITTGPFTARITFSEPVVGFTEEDIVWQTHSGTTVDSTNIGVFMWDYTEVRAGLEYTARMMPEQLGRLWIVVRPGAATSVATGDGNQLGANSLQVELPANRMLVAPAELSVDEGDAEGHGFMVVLTGKPSGTVTVTLNGTEGTALEATSVAGLTFKGVFWTVGRVVKVTAGADANTTDERVTLRLTASGGGYDGQTANVVITVTDTGAGASSASDSDGEDDLVALVDDVTPEVAAAALFGNEGLSDAQLDALDLLGNGNGKYDLGDLLSWLARCGRGEASCGGTVSAADAGSSIPSPALPSQRRARGGRRRQWRTSDSARRRRAAGSATRCFPGTRSAISWLRAALLVAICAAWGCGIGDDIVQPQVAAVDRAQLNPGPLQVRLTAPPGGHAIGAMLRVEGPAIDSLRAAGFELIEPGESSSTQREVIVAGNVAAGSLLQVWVPHVGDRDGYRVRLLQVAGEDFTLGDVAKYQVVISR